MTIPGSDAFRRYVSAQFISSTGTWVQTTALPWLVLDRWHSPTLMGVVVALQFIPILLGGVHAGLIVDRFDRKQVLLVLQLASIVLSLVLAIFVLLCASGS